MFKGWRKGSLKFKALCTPEQDLLTLSFTVVIWLGLSFGWGLSSAFLLGLGRLSLEKYWPVFSLEYEGLSPVWGWEGGLEGEVGASALSIMSLLNAFLLRMLSLLHPVHALVLFCPEAKPLGLW